MSDNKEFARFNPCPHTDIEIPDGDHTISVKMSNGKRLTFSFVGQQKGKPAQCVDIKYHDGGGIVQALGMTKGSHTFDTRKMEKPTTLLVVLLLDEDYPNK